MVGWVFVFTLVFGLFFVFLFLGFPLSLSSIFMLNVSLPSVEEM